MNSVVKAGIFSLVLLVIIGVVAIFLFKDGAEEGENVVNAPPPEAAPEARSVNPEVRPSALRPDPKPAAGEVSFAVRVVDQATRKLLPQATLLVQRVTDGDRPGEKVFESGRRAAGATTGEFTVAVPPGVYQARAQCSGYTTRVEKVTIVKDRPGSTVELALDRGFTISGRILTKDGRRGIGGARVMAYPQIRNPGESLIESLIRMPEITENAQKAPQEDVSADDGSYQISGLEKKYYTVKAIAAAHSPAERSDILPTRDGVNLQLAPGGELSGVVVETTGTPVAGARVSAFSHVDSSELFEIIQTRSRPPLETVTTGPGGEFKLETLGVGSYNFAVSARGYQDGMFPKIKVREGENPPQRFAVSRGLTIAGKVVSAGGEPVAGAKVRATKVGEAARNENLVIKFDDNSIASDDQGRFAFDTLAAGKYTLLAWHTDHASEQRRDIEAGTEDLVITLPAGGAIEGLITEAGTGAPIPGARVSVSDMQDLRKEAVTDESGAYYVGGLNVTGQGKRYLNIQRDGYARVSNVQVHVEEGKVNDKQNFELHRTAQLAGRVVNTKGEGVPGARVMAKRKAANAPTPLTVGSAVSGDDGRYAIKDLEAGEETTLSVLPTASYLEAESQAPFAVAAGESVEAPDIVLQVGGMVKGQVVGPDGRGVTGVAVSVRKEGDTVPDVALTATSEAGGSFLLQGLPAGTVDLVARSPQHIEEVVIGVKVAEGLITQNVRIVLRQGASVSGVVVDGAGQPVRDAQITARDVSESGGLKEHHAESDDQGRFTVSNLLSEDGVAVEVEHPEYGSWSGEKVAVNTPDLKVVLPKLGGVRAQVVDSQGAPVPSFSVQPQPKEDGGESSRKRLPARTFQLGTSSKEGVFEYTGIPPGLYDIQVRAPGFSAATIADIPVEGQVQDLGKVVLEEGGTVSGVVVDTHSGRPIPGATVRVVGGLSRFSPGSAKPAGDASVVATDARGAFEFRNLRGGPVSLQVTAKGYVTKKVEGIDPNVAAGSRDLRVILEQGAEIFGQVVDSQGGARNGISVYLTGVGELASSDSSNQRTATNSEGRFQFQGLSAGTYRVTAQRQGTAGQNPSLEVPLEAGVRQPVELLMD